MNEKPIDENRYGIKNVHTRTIDGQAYISHLYPASVAFDHLPLILDVASGPVSLAVETVQTLVGLGSGEKLEANEVRASFEVLAAAIVKHGGSRKVKELLAHTQVHSPQGLRTVEEEFDVLFQGRPGSILKVLAWVLEVNFVPFYKDVLSGVLDRLTPYLQNFMVNSKHSQHEQTSEDGEASFSESPHTSG